MQYYASLSRYIESHNYILSYDQPKINKLRVNQNFLERFRHKELST